MSELPYSVLPYRIDAADLERFVAARARGRSNAEIRTLGFAPKTFEGTLRSVATLALIDEKSGELTSLGRRMALSGAEDTAPIFLQTLRAFPPYAMLLEVVLSGSPPKPTPLSWIETWWATHGFGSSESNRGEAAPVFAKLVEAAGLGRFVPGRRGRPSRVEWVLGAPRAFVDASLGENEPLEAAAPMIPSIRFAGKARTGGIDRVEAGSEGVTRAGRAVTAGETNSISWVLSPGRYFSIRVPPDLSPEERSKLLQVLDLLLGA